MTPRYFVYVRTVSPGGKAATTVARVPAALADPARAPGPLHTRIDPADGLAFAEYQAVLLKVDAWSARLYEDRDIERWLTIHHDPTGAQYHYVLPAPLPQDLHEAQKN